MNLCLVLSSSLDMQIFGIINNKTKMDKAIYINIYIFIFLCLYIYIYIYIYIYMDRKIDR